MSRSSILVLWLLSNACLKVSAYVFIDVALWSNFASNSYNKLKSAYVRCCKILFRHGQYYNVSVVLAEKVCQISILWLMGLGITTNHKLSVKCIIL